MQQVGSARTVEKLISNLPQIVITATVIGMALMIGFVSPTDIVLVLPVILLVLYFWMVKFKDIRGENV